MRSIVPAAILLGGAAMGAMAAPLPPLPTVDVCGTLVDQTWVPEKRLEALPGASGSLGHDRTVPARMRVTLGEVTGISDDLARLMSKQAGAQAGEVPEGGVLLLLEARGPEDFAGAASLCVTGYTIRGDEGITLTSFTSFTMK